MAQAAAYVLASVAIAIAGLFAGLALMRHLLTMPWRRLLLGRGFMLCNRFATPRRGGDVRQKSAMLRLICRRFHRNNWIY